jgi:hypothetical protein
METDMKKDNSWTLADLEKQCASYGLSHWWTECEIRVAKEWIEKLGDPDIRFVSNEDGALVPVAYGDGRPVEV